MAEGESVSRAALHRGTYRDRVGIAIDAFDTTTILDRAERAEAAGVTQVWMGQVSNSPDALSVIAAAISRTHNLRFGTSIIPIYPRHPLALAQQAMTVATLGPGRLRLGIGPSTRSRNLQIYGLPMHQPLAYLEEYIAVLRAVLWHGKVDHQGVHFTARATFETAPEVPVLASALGEHAFLQAGRVTDGAISWNCPPSYLRSIAIPAMGAGAQGENRSVPPLVAHVWVALSSNREAIRGAARGELEFYAGLPFYAAMFAAAGFPIPDDGSVPEGLIESLVVSGDEEQIAAKLRDLLDSGLDELLVSRVPLSNDEEEFTRLFQMVGHL